MKDRLPFKSGGINRGKAWIGVVFFVMAFIPGLWFTALPNILAANGIEEFLPLTIACITGFGLVAPLFIGALADNRLSGEKVLGVLSILGAGFLFFAFYSLDQGFSKWLFLFCISMNALVSGPMWSLLAAIALAHSPTPEKTFPLLRVWGTVGWMVAGLITSFWLQADENPLGGMVAGGLRLVLGILCIFCLPRTPPKGKSHSKTWKERLGLGALGTLNSRSDRVFLLSAFLFGVVLTAFMMYAPRHLEHMGATHITALMTIGQVSEIPAILLVGVIAIRFRFKHILLVALACAAIRYTLFASAEFTGSIPILLIGIFMHGLVYTLFFVTSQFFIERRVPSAIRNQSQTFFGLLSGGMGSLVGSQLSGVAYRWMILEQHGGWNAFWALHASLCCGIFILFATGFTRSARTAELDQNSA